ncbi:hypothetical protein DFJ74DRAFT_772399, partial [Hyaloraphidium curvatum]
QALGCHAERGPRCKCEGIEERIGLGARFWSIRKRIPLSFTRSPRSENADSPPPAWPAPRTRSPAGCRWTARIPACAPRASGRRCPRAPRGRPPARRRPVRRTRNCSTRYGQSSRFRASPTRRPSSASKPPASRAWEAPWTPRTPRTGTTGSTGPRRRGRWRTSGSARSRSTGWRGPRG